MTPTQLTEQELAATDVGEYKYGFHDQVTSVFRTRRGLDEKVVRERSRRTSREPGESPQPETPADADVASRLLSKGETPNDSSPRNRVNPKSRCAAGSSATITQPLMGAKTVGPSEPGGVIITSLGAEARWHPRPA